VLKESRGSRAAGSGGERNLPVYFMRQAASGAGGSAEAMAIADGTGRQVNGVRSIVVCWRWRRPIWVAVAGAKRVHDLRIERSKHTERGPGDGRRRGR